MQIFTSSLQGRKARLINCVSERDKMYIDSQNSETMKQILSNSNHLTSSNQSYSLDFNKGFNSIKNKEVQITNPGMKNSKKKVIDLNGKRIGSDKIISSIKNKKCVSLRQDSQVNSVMIDEMTPKQVEDQGSVVDSQNSKYVLTLNKTNIQLGLND